MLQYKIAQTVILTKFHPIVGAGKSSQQWIVDSYLQVEANNLNFVQIISDHVTDDAANLRVQAGVPVCQVRMVMFAKFGSIDLLQSWQYIQYGFMALHSSVMALGYNMEIRGSY